MPSLLQGAEAVTDFYPHNNSIKSAGLTKHRGWLAQLHPVSFGAHLDWNPSLAFSSKVPGGGGGREMAVESTSHTGILSDSENHSKVSNSE